MASAAIGIVYCIFQLVLFFGYKQRMKTTLARVFIEKSIITRGTVFEAYYNAKGISGQCNAEVIGKFKLTGAQMVGDWIYFNTIDYDKNTYRLRCDAVLSLDGMPVKRVAESHQLTEDGVDHKFIRRGRRRKDEIVDEY